MNQKGLSGFKNLTGLIFFGIIYSVFSVSHTGLTLHFRFPLFFFLFPNAK